MSTSLTTLVPVLTGPNYTSWAPIMQSFLMSQGQWKVVANPPPKAIHKEATKASELLTEEEELRKAMEAGEITNQQDILDWWDLNAKALGNLRLRLHHTIQYNQRDAITAAQLWETLEEKYGKPGMASIYLELKSAFDTPIPANSDPSLALEKITSHFGKLREAGSKVTLSNHLQALIIMAKLPSSYDSLAQIMCQVEKVTDLSLKKVVGAIGISWDQRNNGGARGARPQNQKNANAISGVQRGPRDTPFNQQQQYDSRGGRGGRRPRGRRGGQNKRGQQQQQGNQADGNVATGCHHLLSSLHPISVLGR